MKASDLGSVLPGDAQQLFEVLSAVEAKVEILPATLRGASEFRAARIRDFMWKSDEEDRSLTCETISGNHARFRDVVNDSIASSNLHRSEAAWNNLVHTPLLRHATSLFDFLQVEPITSARIMPAFRPLSKTGNQSLSSSISSASSMSEQDLGTPQTRSGSVASSVHKMVDFALVLQPKEGLQKLIDTFLDTQPQTTATINQTIYEPLRTRPAPIFIETKTSLGNIDAANVQLGVWVAAWHERMRSILSLAVISSKIITIPVIQVVGSVWTVMFVKDTDAEIQILDTNFRIGDTDSILGVYQLQAAISALADWTRATFEPWLTGVLRQAKVLPGPIQGTVLFTSTRSSHGIRLDDACAGRRLPDGLSGDAAPRVLTAGKFQTLERRVQKDWLHIMGPAIEETPEVERNRACRQALRHMGLLAGPNWARDERMWMEHVVPWHRGKDDFFRHPLSPTRFVQDGADDPLLSKPTIMLPSRHNVMKLIARIRSFRGRSPEVERRLQWTMRLLHNGGKQYDMLTHLGAKKKAAEVTRQSPSLLRQFLSQSEPPQECVQSGGVDKEETDSESDWCGSVTEEEERDVSEELGSLVYDSAIEV
ncbi:serine/threonine-protein phosphatase 2A activator 2 [Purpureocillium lavendulum]|uniref:Serine/threonine-protein phosphatase 2A activator 2 n=1 Tax=Purpureocillium lavendulum TaxID=1247861 RepID=A0AB34FJ40_9HYPO|nr:serine/threonine-protein phosphatase 2A activator 2 [Purpureocillium lavendulum]